MEEYYLRAPGTETEDGPFTVEQLRELADSEVIKPETLVRPVGETEFAPMSEEGELWESIRPKPKAALKLKKPTPPSLPPSNKGKKPATAGTATAGAAGAAAVSGSAGKKKKNEPAPPSPMDESGDVDRFLSAAEGKTEKTRHIQRLKKSRARAVALLLPTVVFSLLMLVAIVVQPSWEAIFEMFKSGDYTFSILTENWILLFAIVDLVLAIGIGLGQTSLFPFLRLRAAIGIGFFLFLFYSRQEWLAAGAMTALQTGLLFATVCVRLYTTLVFSILAFGGGAAMIWLVWFKGIAF